MLGLSFQELLIIGAIAVMLFGKRLPEVAKSLGGQYRDLRKGLSDIQSQMDFGDTFSSRSTSSKPTNRYAPDESEDIDQPTAPKLELPPVAEAESTPSEPTS